MSGHWQCRNRPLSGSHLEAKVDTVYSLLSMLNHQNKNEMIEKLHEMSVNVSVCYELRHYGCLPLLVQLIHPLDDYDQSTEKSVDDQQVRQRASEALHNVVRANDDKREIRVLRLLEEIRLFSDALRSVNWPAEDEDLLSTQQHPGPAISSLMKFSFDEKHRQAICELGGLQAIAELLHNDCEFHGNTVNTQCVTIRRYASMALTNLTFGDERNKSLLCSMKYFMRALVKQLHSPSEELRQVTASVLRNLSWRADKVSKQILRDVGVVVTLMKAALEATKESTLKSILSALWNLSAHSVANKSDICAVDGALRFLVSTLTYKSISNTLAIIENGGGILRNVSSHVAVNEEYRVILRENNCLQILLEQLKSPSLTVVSNACGTLWNLSARCSHDQKILWELGAVGMLKNLVNSKHKMISIGSKAALKNLLSADIPGFTPNLTDGSAGNSETDPVPSLPARKLKAFKAELDENISETCDNIESPKHSPSHSISSVGMGHHGRGSANQYLPYRMYTSFSGNNGFISRSSSRDSIGSTHSEPYNMYRLHRYGPRPHHSHFNETLGATYWAQPAQTYDPTGFLNVHLAASNNSCSPVEVVTKAFEFCENLSSGPSSSSSVESHEKEDAELHSSGETPDLLTDLMPSRRTHNYSSNSFVTHPKVFLLGDLERENRERSFKCEKISEDDSELLETLKTDESTLDEVHESSSKSCYNTEMEKCQKDNTKEGDNQKEISPEDENPTANRKENERTQVDNELTAVQQFPRDNAEVINSEALNLLTSIASDLTASSCLSDLESIKPPSLMDEVSMSLTSSSCMTDSINNQKPQMKLKSRKHRRIPVAKKNITSKASRSASSNEIFLAYTNPPSLMEEVSGLSSSCCSLNSIPSEVYDPPIESIRRLKEEATVIVQHYTKEINQLTASYNSTSCDSDILEKIKPPKIFRETKSINGSTYVTGDISDVEDFDDLPKDSNENSTLVPDDTSVDVSTLPLSSTDPASYDYENDFSYRSDATINDTYTLDNASGTKQKEVIQKAEDYAEHKIRNDEVFLDNDSTSSIVSTSDDDSKATYTCSPKKARIVKPVNRSIGRKDESMAKKVTVKNMKKNFSPQHTSTPPNCPSVKGTRTTALRAARSKSAEYPNESNTGSKTNLADKKENCTTKCYHSQTFVIRRKANQTASAVDKSNGNIPRNPEIPNTRKPLLEKDTKKQVNITRINEKNNNLINDGTSPPKKREVQSKIASLWKRNKVKDSSKEKPKTSKIMTPTSITRSSTYEKLPNSNEEAVKLDNKMLKPSSLAKVRPYDAIFSSDAKKFTFNGNHTEKERPTLKNNSKKNASTTGV